MLDIERYVAGRFDQYDYYGNPVTDMRVDCPFCDGRGAGEDTGRHLYISLDKQATHCFRCGYASSWIRFVMELSCVPYYQAIGLLYEPAKLRGDLKQTIQASMGRSLGAIHIVKTFKLPSDFRFLNRHMRMTRLAMTAMKYLVERGFEEAQWEHYNLGVSEEIGYRIIIPIEDGYWQGRAIYNMEQPKYVNPKMPSSQVIFNATALTSYDEVVICEGAFSAMAVGYNAVALVGKEATPDKLDRFINAPVDRYIIALEPGAFRAIGKLADALSRSGKQVTIWRYSVGDPADPDGKFEVLDYTLKSKLELLMK